MVDLPGGLGRTTIAAAISAGLLPEGWTPSGPFEVAPAAAGGGSKVPPSGTAGNTDGNPEEDQGPDYAARRIAVDEASRLLSDAHATLGQDVLDGVLHAVVETGELEPGMIPEGVTEETIAAVHAGYKAQAEHVLAQIGTSVAGLEAMLTDAELKGARQAVLGGDAERLKDIGALAARRLSQLPDANPVLFREMVDNLPADQGKAIRYDDDHRAWIVTIPGAGQMTFGAAVNLGFVRY